MELVSKESKDLHLLVFLSILFKELPFNHLLIQDGDGNKLLILHRETLEMLNTFKFTDAMIIDVKPMFKGLCLF